MCEERAAEENEGQTNRLFIPCREASETKRNGKFGSSSGGAAYGELVGDLTSFIGIIAHPRATGRVSFIVFHATRPIWRWLALRSVDLANFVSTSYNSLLATIRVCIRYMGAQLNCMLFGTVYDRLAANFRSRREQDQDVEGRRTYPQNSYKEPRLEERMRVSASGADLDRLYCQSSRGLISRNRASAPKQRPDEDIKDGRSN